MSISEADLSSINSTNLAYTGSTPPSSHADDNDELNFEYRHKAGIEVKLGYSTDDGEKWKTLNNTKMQTISNLNMSENIISGRISHNLNFHSVFSNNVYFNCKLLGAC